MDGPLLSPRFWAWLLIPAAAYLLLLLWIYLTQERLLYLPDLPERALTVTPAAAGLPYEEVRLTAADGVELGAWFLPAAEPDRGTLLFFHGNAGNRGHRLESLKLFHDLGLNLFIIDYRGYGDSDGLASEPGTALDAAAAWRHLTGERGIPPGQIVIFGRSLGAAVALQLTGETWPRAVIIESAFTSVADVGAEHYPWLPVRWLARIHYDNLARVRSLDAPLLVIHSRGDEIIPFRHGVALHAAARGPKRLLEISGGHNDGFLVSGDGYRDGLAAFLDAHPPR